MNDVVIRPIEPGDAERLGRMFSRLSPTTVYRRFFTMVPAPRPSVLRHFATVDHDRRDALVAVDGDEIVAVARYDRLLADPSTAEVAITVEDAWQRHHLATRLLGELAAVAARRGITRFVAHTLGENTPAVQLARSMNPRMHLAWEGGELAMEMPLSA